MRQFDIDHDKCNDFFDTLAVRLNLQIDNRKFFGKFEEWFNGDYVRGKASFAVDRLNVTVRLSATTISIYMNRSDGIERYEQREAFVTVRPPFDSFVVDFIALVVGNPNHFLD